MKNIVLSFNSSVQQIFINELSEGTFFAQILYERDDDRVELDARPSDAIAVAIRFGAPIYVHPDVLDEAGIVSEETARESADQPAPGKPSHQKPEMSKLEQLEQDLQLAIKTENYEKAAKIRDQIQKLKG